MIKPTENELSQAFSDAHERSPETDSWGLFAYSDAPPVICGSGLGSFSWFDSKVELIAFVADSLAWWHPAPSSMETEEIASTVKAIIEDTDPLIVELEQLRGELNSFMSNMWQIAWWGTFGELCTSLDEYPVQIREWFYGRQGTEIDPKTPIERDLREEFAECLREYGI